MRTAHESTTFVNKYVLGVAVGFAVYAISFGVFLWVNLWSDTHRANVVLAGVDGFLVIAALVLSGTCFAKRRWGHGLAVVLGLLVASVLSLYCTILLFSWLYGPFGGD